MKKKLTKKQMEGMTVEEIQAETIKLADEQINLLVVAVKDLQRKLYLSYKRECKVQRKLMRIVEEFDNEEG